MPDLMNTFPSVPASQVTLANWRMSPFSRWAFHHVREIVPTAEIPHDPGHVLALQNDVMSFEGLTIDAGNGRKLAFAQFLVETNTDALVILKNGRLVFEHYAHGMTAHSPHILMSVSKSMLGLLAGILQAGGVLDCDRAVTAYVPEVAATAYAGATVRDLLDMRVGIAFAEDYLATSGPIVEYRKSTGWNPPGPGESASDLRSFLRTLTPTGRAHGLPE
jgi:CubicO group peptidase (beta-lactamase class C family)